MAAKKSPAKKGIEKKAKGSGSGPTKSLAKDLGSRPQKNPADKTMAKKAVPPASAREAAPVVDKNSKNGVNPGFDFIGTFPMRKNGNDKKGDAKKLPQGPVFPQGEYLVAARDTPLARVMLDEFKATYLAKHSQDKIKTEIIPVAIDKDPVTASKMHAMAPVYSKELDEALNSRRIDIAIHNMKDIPLDLAPGLVLASSLRREDPRDAMITRSTYGAIQELPSRAKVATTSKRRIMQIKALRPDIEIVPVYGDVQTRINALETQGLDAVIVAWSSLKRLNLSPRFYVSLQAELMTPAASQGTIGIVCRAEDADLIAKLRYIEDSEASWSARCERAFLHKLGGFRDVPVGVFAHRKGTQDPWILDSVIGDQRSGEILRHREIGTSRCKPESLADKAFMGILSKGARKFLPFS